MKQNIGTIDCRIRRTVAWTFVFIMVLKLISVVWASIATFTAIFLLFTAFMPHCPLYKIFGINTLETKNINKI
jgi:hypothetical protein